MVNTYLSKAERDEYYEGVEGKNLLKPLKDYINRNGTEWVYSIPHPVCKNQLLEKFHSTTLENVLCCAAYLLHNNHTIDHAHFAFNIVNTLKRSHSERDLRRGKNLLSAMKAIVFIVFTTDMTRDTLLERLRSEEVSSSDLKVILWLVCLYYHTINRLYPNRFFQSKNFSIIRTPAPGGAISGYVAPQFFESPEDLDEYLSCVGKPYDRGGSRSPSTGKVRHWTG